jgi:hypothetical protein
MAVFQSCKQASKLLLLLLLLLLLQPWPVTRLACCSTPSLAALRDASLLSISLLL